METTTQSDIIVRAEAILATPVSLRKAAATVFAKHDRDNSNHLDDAELSKFIRGLLGFMKLGNVEPETLLHAVTRNFDRDETGLNIDSKQFVLFYKICLEAVLELARPDTSIGVLNKSVMVNHVILGAANKPSSIWQMYDKGKVLGKGAFGVAYCCVDRTTKQKVCVKEQLYGQGGSSSRCGLLNEIGIMKSIDHPSIVRIREVVECPKERKIYIVMDLIVGKELSTRLDSRRARAVDTGYIEYWRRTLYAMLQAINYMHSCNVVHSDLKPENIMEESGDGTLKLLDFGVASGSGNNSAVCGSPLFMSPESWQGRAALKTDIWSVGVIAYQALTGMDPWVITNKLGRARYPSTLEEVKKIVLDPAYQVDYKHLSCRQFPLMKDFISRCLTYSVRNRPSAKEAVQHPWFAGLAEQASSLDSRTTRKMFGVMQKHVAESDRLKQLLSNMMFHELDANCVDLKNARNLFMELDRNGDGVLTNDEIRRGLASLSWKPRDVDHIVKILDADASGSITISEFSALCVHVTEREIAVMRKVFDKLDEENAGWLSVENFVQIADADSRANLAQLVDNIDKNKDGRVDFEEFVSYMLQ